MLGSFWGLSQVGGNDWVLGVYRSKNGLYDSDPRFGLFGTSIEFTSVGSVVVACVLAMLISLLLMYYTYNLARREQVRTEEARARLAAIVQDSDDAIYSQTFDGHITSWNRGAEQVFGFAETEAVSRESQTLIPSQREADEQKIIRQIERGESPPEHAVEAIRVRKDGRPIHVLAIDLAAGRCERPLHRRFDHRPRHLGPEKSRTRSARDHQQRTAAHRPRLARQPGPGADRPELPRQGVDAKTVGR